MRRFLASLALVAVTVASLGAASTVPAMADTEWYDCHTPGVYWRFSGGIWRYGFHDRPRFGVSTRNRSPYDPPAGCGAFPSEDGIGARDRFDSPYGEPRPAGRQRIGARESRHIRACMLRYRTYDSRSDTFVGRDGRPHPCRL